MFRVAIAIDLVGVLSLECARLELARDKMATFTASLRKVRLCLVFRSANGRVSFLSNGFMCTLESMVFDHSVIKDKAGICETMHGVSG